MNSVLISLKNLQELDDNLRDVAQILLEGDSRLAKAEAKFRNFETRLSDLRVDLDNMRTRHRALEAEVSDLSVKKKNNENRQLSVKNNNEYTALAKEEEFLRGRINELEDATLELLDSMEKRELEVSNLTLVLAEEEEIYNRSVAEIKSAQQSGREQQATLKASREATAAEIPAARLKQYDDTFKTRAGRAVTACTGGLCLACRLEFPAQLFNELRRNDKILSCPNCNRIIYWQDHPDFQTES